MKYRRQSNGEIVELDVPNKAGSGGEGAVYPLLQDDKLMAKIYKKEKEPNVAKLLCMIENPPRDPMKAKGHVSFAWPQDLLESLDGRGGVAGFVMPKIEGTELIELYNPIPRANAFPDFNYSKIHYAGMNLASVIEALHTMDYVIGDISQTNIFVNKQTLISVIDTDSFQIRDHRTGEIYPCLVGRDEFIPRELQSSPRNEPRKPEQDLFGLAVLLFLLLLEGKAPFAGVYKGPGEPPEYGERIAKGYFPYSRKRVVPFAPAKLPPSFDIVHPALQEWFITCFEDGHDEPEKRPRAEIWRKALKEAEACLITCGVNNNHRYGNHLPECPWCEIARAGVDLYPPSGARRTRAGGASPVTEPRITAFYAEAMSLIAGNASALHWKVSNASSVIIDQGVGPVPHSGSLRVSPAVTTTYTITAENAGRRVTRAVHIMVLTPPDVTFEAGQSKIYAGQAVILQWAVSFAEGVSISGIGPVALSGAAEVYPIKDHTYTLTVRWNGGTLSRQVTIKVSDEFLPLDKATIALNEPVGLGDVSIQMRTYAPLNPATAILRGYEPLQKTYLPLRGFEDLGDVSIPLMAYESLGFKPRRPRLLEPGSRLESGGTRKS